MVGIILPIHIEELFSITIIYKFSYMLIYSVLSFSSIGFAPSRNYMENEGCSVMIGMCSGFRCILVYLYK
ncbi:mitogen-activated protein kinase kinase kinase NPK1 [Iris pallida]|uniref:Mitogen-activated protein kinase kinase kinase NPK1 n=1 Tax=Iris pallida TaxID=29817 RepID=A0AAX6G536_IRIPA|nr:mitogen-activated protein kinase kinase kinase NPK1 [Iris pallida]